MFLSSLPFVYSKRAAAARSPVSRYRRLRLNVLSVFLSGPAGSNYPALPYFDQTVPYHLWRSLGTPPSVHCSSSGYFGFFSREKYIVRLDVLRSHGVSINYTSNQPGRACSSSTALMASRWARAWARARAHSGHDLRCPSHGHRQGIITIVGRVCDSRRRRSDSRRRCCSRRGRWQCDSRARAGHGIRFRLIPAKRRPNVPARTGPGLLPCSHRDSLFDCV